MRLNILLVYADHQTVLDMNLRCSLPTLRYVDVFMGCLFFTNAIYGLVDHRIVRFRVACEHTHSVR